MTRNQSDTDGTLMELAKEMPELDVSESMSQKMTEYLTKSRAESTLKQLEANSGPSAVDCAGLAVGHALHVTCQVPSSGPLVLTDPSGPFPETSAPRKVLGREPALQDIVTARLPRNMTLWQGTWSD